MAFSIGTLPISPTGSYWRPWPESPIVRFRQTVPQASAPRMTVSEMVTSRPDLRSIVARLACAWIISGEPGPDHVVQIAGGIPQMMAEAARLTTSINGAQIIDINMGCPAKKVCKVDAGSALLKDEAPGRNRFCTRSWSIGSNVPVTLKIRTGWSRTRTGTRSQIARIAEASGIQALTIHGRTREDRFLGSAEYSTIREVKKIVRIPVIANGDIDSVKKAQMVMDFTAADAIMVGRIAQQRPWIFGQIEHYLTTGLEPEEPSDDLKQSWLESHLRHLYAFYGEHQGVRIARKHINWQLAQKKNYHRVKPAADAGSNSRSAAANDRRLLYDDLPPGKL